MVFFLEHKQGKTGTGMRLNKQQYTERMDWKHDEYQTSILQLRLYIRTPSS